MARSLSAYLVRADVPARAALQKAVDALKLKVVLDDAYVPFESSGYLPCTFDGEDAGFTIRFRDVSAGSDPTAALGARDCAIELRWGGDVREEVSALAVAAALAIGFDAKVQDEDRWPAGDALAARARARATLKDD